MNHQKLSRTIDMSSNRGRGRGSFRGRNRVKRVWQGDRAFYNRTEPAPPQKPAGPTIDSISLTTLMVEESAPEIDNVEFVASYNWLNQKTPTILVPGSPPAWTPPEEDVKLDQDSEDVFRDINAARYPSYPMEPMFRSICAMKPEFPFEEIDVVGCGSTLGNLLRFARSESESFRFKVDIVGDTVWFIRRENSPTEMITGMKGHGHTFPDAYTTWDPEVRNSVSHQRIVRYEFGGLDFLVRYESDGYVRDDAAGTLAKTVSGTEDESVDLSLETMKVSSTVAATDEPLQVQLGGREVRQDQVFEIKTRAHYKTYDMNEILPRLWVSRIPRFLIAYHQGGLFNKPQIQDIRNEVQNWEEANLSMLARFHAVVKRIVDVVRDVDHQCEVYWDGEGPLIVTEQVGDDKRALPSDLLELWEE